MAFNLCSFALSQSKIRFH